MKKIIIGLVALLSIPVFAGQSESYSCAFEGTYVKVSSNGKRMYVINKNEEVKLKITNVSSSFAYAGLGQPAVKDSKSYSAGENMLTIESNVINGDEKTLGYSLDATLLLDGEPLSSGTCIKNY